jgi:hypothetical protein
MMLAPVCLALGVGTVVAQNMPEIRDTIRSGERHAYGGTAMYISTASLSRAMKLWVAAKAIERLVRAASSQRAVVS